MSLDKILFHPQWSKELDWPKRLNIILGVACGLLYLHQDSQLQIVHRDIKTSNILLDEKIQPKISDFGLARLFHPDETRQHNGFRSTVWRSYKGGSIVDVIDKTIVKSFSHEEISRYIHVLLPAILHFYQHPCLGNLIKHDQKSLCCQDPFQSILMW